MQDEMIHELLISAARSSASSIVGDTVYFWASNDVYFSIGVDDIMSDGQSVIRICNNKTGDVDEIEIGGDFKSRLLDAVNF